MSYNAKNYTEQGGDKTVIGGTLEIKEGATVTGLPACESTDVICEFTFDEETEKWKCSKTAEELSTALNNKHNVYCYYISDIDCIKFILGHAAVNGDTGLYLKFGVPGDINITAFYSSGDWTVNLPE